MAFGVLAVSLAGCAADPPDALVSVRVTGCTPQVERGVGAMIDDGLILASAHVVAGAETLDVVDRRGRRVAAEVAAFDPDLDLALLSVDDRRRRHPLDLYDGELIERGADATVWTVRGDEFVRLDATVVRPVSIDTEDIYIDADVTRPGYEIAAAIEPGDSGAPVIVGGEIIGVVWARSRIAEGRAYAIDPVVGGATIERQLAGDEPLPDLERCR